MGEATHLVPHTTAAPHPAGRHTHKHITVRSRQPARPLWIQPATSLHHFRHAVLGARLFGNAARLPAHEAEEHTGLFLLHIATSSTLACSPRTPTFPLASFLYATICLLFHSMN